MIKNYLSFSPKIAKTAYVDEQALVAGRVHIGENSSIWPMAVLRGDVHEIFIGADTNIQDGTICHVTHDGIYNPGGIPLVVGNKVTVGHKVILHACTIEDLVLVGMGAIVMDGAVLEKNTIIGAGSLVSPHKKLESGYLWLGSPVKKIRALTDKELAFLEYSAAHYVRLKNNHQS
ncbi:MAG: gamma carbonic anhydrase family protein [Gammaproteobacteria bacterium]